MDNVTVIFDPKKMQLKIIFHSRGGFTKKMIVENFLMGGGEYVSVLNKEGQIQLIKQLVGKL